MSGAALSFTRGNVTAEDPMMQDGDFRVGTLEAHLVGMERFMPTFLWSKIC